MKRYTVTFLLCAAVLAAAVLSTPVRTYPETAVNTVAPALILRDLDNRLVFGKKILKEKPLLISFFFTGCKPCEREIPELERLYRLYGRKVGMYLVSTDKEGAEVVAPYVKKMNITVPALIDKYSDAARDFGVNKYPSLFIIGRDGRVKYACVGYREENMRAAEEVLKKLR